ncbi:hypothetical protein [Rhodohalobacter sp. 8-1]|uniref:hypothetical protein n=1 Tax=Rhodohalobacter sp. 8-1 TaxID=3131972 RepID=UPI0030ECC942
MNILKGTMFGNKPKKATKEWIVESFKTNLEDYFTRQISIRECLFKTGTLTADLIAYHNTDVNISKNIYNSITLMATNYYTFLYSVDIHLSFYTLNQQNVYNQVVELMDVIIDKYGVKNLDGSPDSIYGTAYNPCVYTKGLVDVFFSDGYEGCRKYLASAIADELKSNDPAHSVRLDEIETINRELPDRKFFAPHEGNDFL